MIPEFALRLICGLSIIWCLAPRAQITSGFFRIQMLLTLGLSVLLILTFDQLKIAGTDAAIAKSWIWFGGIFLALTSFLGSVLWTLERRKSGTVFVYLVAFISAGVLGFLAMNTLSANESPARALADQFTAAWLIGSVTAAMLLGHWYLTATGMVLAPLVRLSQVFAVTVVLRAAVTIFGARPVEAGQELAWSLLTLRWAGLIGPFAMAILTIRILKYHNTQSATGVLYAATTLVFMGEMAASLVQ